MQIKRLQITHIRNVSRSSLSLSPINIFYGANGSGKTSLLEAIHLLLVGRSFRHAHMRPLISEGQDQCSVFAELVSSDTMSRITLGIGRQRDASKPIVKINGEPVQQLAELVRIAPVQVLGADSFELLTGGPAQRRRFLDWGLFHVEPDFYPAWLLAQRALKQRNSLIRRGKIDDQLRLWTREYGRYGEQVDRMRQVYIEQLLPICQQLATALLPELKHGLELAYNAGWSKDHSLIDALEAGLDSDLQQGHTRLGPHRADLKVEAGPYAAAEVFSRGQLKMLVAALYLAQAELLQAVTEKRSIFLIDDLSAELDEVNRRRLCAQLERLGVQVFASGIQANELIDCWSSADQIQVFHVEQGFITPANLARRSEELHER